MNNKKCIVYGLTVTFIIMAVSLYAGDKLSIRSDFIPDSFVGYSLILLLSICIIYGFKNYVNYKIAVPKAKNLFKPIGITLFSSIVFNIAFVALSKSAGGEPEVHYGFDTMSGLQFFLFIFIYASLAEELLFRGFLMNLLSPLSHKAVSICKIKISVPVLISAAAFGLTHLLLIRTGAGGVFLLRVVSFTTMVGMLAGYYQEKYSNNAFAIIVHMSSNFIGLIGVILLNVSA